jgi:cytochrome P450
MHSAVRYIPAWFPGAGFKRTAKEWKAFNENMRTKPFNTVKEEMATGIHGGSVASRLLTCDDKGALTEEEDDRIKWLLGSIYTGGADTTVSALTSFVLAMVLYPDAQKKAQAEIDDAIGNERFPLLDDRDRMPYVEALYKEVLRWHPIAPLGVPHRLTKEDTWGDYTLPKGSTVIANIWAMGQTEEDSSSFKPERHLYEPGENKGLDPREYVFGFGRRICPGRDLADAGT